MRAERPLDECYRDVELAGPSLELLQRVAGSCAPGMQSLAGPVQSAELAFEVEHAERCLRAFAVSDGPEATLSLALEGPSGELGAIRVEHSRVAALPAAGALCPDAPGAYRLKVQPPSAAPPALGVWQAR